MVYAREILLFFLSLSLSSISPFLPFRCIRCWLQSPGNPSICLAPSLLLWSYPRLPHSHKRHAWRGSVGSSLADGSFSFSRSMTRSKQALSPTHKENKRRCPRIASFERQYSKVSLPSS
ncbi:hypothetical protein BGZ63DRAFT_179569 [Mariannaea sp. PMI_226]|nr:hypothetical protein BGZ63DRAFT_179569 [Mariannaea sp. PMI_226]